MGRSDDDIPPSQAKSMARRKVRKGTRSCWECKRRKIRCIFASSDDVICIGCQRRRMACVSQDMPEELSPARIGNRHLGERITKIENLISDILTGKDKADRDERGLLKDHIWSRTPLTPAQSSEEPGSSLSFNIPSPQDLFEPNESGATLHHLFQSFPAERDVRILLDESHKTALYTELLNTQPHSKITLRTLSTPYKLDLPGPNSHPVIVAKTMLMFAITLQSPGGDRLLDLSEPSSTIMHHLATAATTWVTTKAEMHGTIEGLICIMLEGIFELNNGNLRQAWAVFRRAMAVAQLMGLHRSPVPPLKFISSRFDVNAQAIWFRIVQMDRYLSLLLRLPQGSSDKSMGWASILPEEPPLGTFERHLTVIASRILERNDRPFDPSEIATTQAIDSELLSLSSEMPEEFWRPTNFQNLVQGSPQTLLETLRLGAQVYYYGLLIHLHLPYMIRVDDNIQNEYSKITCVNASREIITRFVIHRTFNPLSSCSRPVDFFALVAAMTLLLAHLDVHHHPEATNFLAHQRLSDRAMLSQALERMDAISDANKDIVNYKSAKLIRRLLDIEADAAKGRTYTTESVGINDEVEKAEELRLQIPYLGIIKIGPQGPICREPSVGNIPSSQCQNLQEPLTISTTTDLSLSLTSSTDTYLPSHLDDTIEDSVCVKAPTDAQATPKYADSSLDGTTLPVLDPPSLLMPTDDWDLQGVDMAFFESVMRGTTGMETAWSGEQCTGD